MIVCNPLRNSLLLVGSQVLETWLTCVCWHVTWNSCIVSMEIARKCLFNTRISLCIPLLISTFNYSETKVLFVRAQVSETWLTCVCWHVTWNSCIVSIEIARKCLFNTRISLCIPLFISTFNYSETKVLFVRAQRGEMLIVGFLDTNYLVLIGFWYALCWSFLRCSVSANQKEMSLLSALTCVHHPLPLSRTSGMQPTD